MQRPKERKYVVKSHWNTAAAKKRVPVTWNVQQHLRPVAILASEKEQSRGLSHLNKLVCLGANLIFTTEVALCIKKNKLIYKNVLGNSHLCPQHCLINTIFYHGRRPRSLNISIKLTLRVDYFVHLLLFSFCNSFHCFQLECRCLLFQYSCCHNLF